MVVDTYLHRPHNLLKTLVALDDCAAIIGYWHLYWHGDIKARQLCRRRDLLCRLWNIRRLGWRLDLLCWRRDILRQRCARLRAHAGELGQAVQVLLAILENGATSQRRVPLRMLADFHLHRVHHLLIARVALDGCVAILWR
jgi:hypothetical protein